MWVDVFLGFSPVLDRSLDHKHALAGPWQGWAAPAWTLLQHGHCSSCPTWLWEQWETCSEGVGVNLARGAVREGWLHLGKLSFPLCTTGLLGLRSVSCKPH